MTEFTHNGCRYHLTLERDDDATPPWERDDGHGPVSAWRPLSSKRAGERVLHADRKSARFYDFAEAVAIARRDGWDAPPYGQSTPGQRAARAAEADFERLRAWCNDKWEYVGVCVRLVGAAGSQYDHAFWGVESDCEDYIAEVARELDGEAAESKWAASYGIPTCAHHAAAGA
jgi:hypothetical protein